VDEVIDLWHSGKAHGRDGWTRSSTASKVSPGRSPSRPAGRTLRYRLYQELAGWWPLISPAAEYAEEAAYLATVLRSAAIPVREVLELGSGGGHNAAHLKASMTMTLVDLSSQMLAVSRRLNPHCEHHMGDMRSVRLGREFDAVLVHDAVDYMTTQADLRSVMETAFAHCRPGGIAVFVPDHTVESFQAGNDSGGSADPSGREARFLARLWDPDPADSWIQSDYTFVLREADGSVRVVRETHRLGLFGRHVWLALLDDAGFRPDAVTEATTEDRSPRELFLGHRPQA
jgi:trans-aconitate methyltransferase